jgi:O-antigen chain-terminating bifunctional methyltransferase/kinase
MSTASLVKALPEVYQPIFGHPELSARAARKSKDRLACVVSTFRALEAALVGPLTVLDLGCAQGFFSLHLSALGARVHGIDFFEANIAVCKALAEERDDTTVLFQTARIENYPVRIVLCSAGAAICSGHVLA